MYKVAKAENEGENMKDFQNSNYTVRLLKESDWENYKSFRIRSLDQTFVNLARIAELEGK